MLPTSACLGLLDDAALVVAVALLILLAAALALRFSGVEFNVEFGDPPEDEKRDASD